jgi:predicted secreted protein
MGPVSIFAIYFVVWWLAFLAVLPFGVRTLEETGEHESGQAQSAPSRPLLVRKVVAATVIAAMICSLVYILVEFKTITIDDIGIFNPPGR